MYIMNYFVVNIVVFINEKNSKHSIIIIMFLVGFVKVKDSLRFQASIIVLFANNLVTLDADRFLFI